MGSGRRQKTIEGATFCFSSFPNGVRRSFKRIVGRFLISGNIFRFFPSSGFCFNEGYRIIKSIWIALFLMYLGGMLKA